MEQIILFLVIQFEIAASKPKFQIRNDFVSCSYNEIGFLPQVTIKK